MLAMDALCKQVDSRRVRSETASSRMRTGETRLGGGLEGRSCFLRVVGREDGMHDRWYAEGGRCTSPRQLDIPPALLDSALWAELFYS